MLLFENFGLKVLKIKWPKQQSAQGRAIKGFCLYTSEVTLFMPYACYNKFHNVV